MPFPEAPDPRGLACFGRDTCVVTVRPRGGALGHVTFDGGVSWTAIEPHLNIEELAGIQYDRLGRLYATSQPYFGGSIVRSDDYGRSWRTVGEQAAVRRVSLVPGEDTLLFALAEGGRLVAMDTSGAVLYETTVPLRDNYTTDELRAFDRDRLHVANSRTLFRSADGGRTWDASPQPIARLIGFETSAVGVAVTTEEECVDYDVGLYRQVFAVTDDGGDNWEKATVRTSDLDHRISTCDYLGEGEWRCVMGSEVIALRRE